MPTITTRNRLLILGGILIIALGLRLYRAGTYGIYFDEKSTLLISQGVCLEGANQRDVFTQTYFTPRQFWKPKTLADFMEANARGDIGSPFYFWILWCWIKVFGLSDLSIRLPSVIFSTLTIGLLYAFVKRHIRLKAPDQTEALALLACGLAAVEPFFIAYSQMARTYSLTFFMTLLATHVFGVIVERQLQPQSKQPLVLYGCYGLLVALCIYSHYLTATVFLGHAAYALLYVRRLSTWVWLGAAALFGALLTLPWFLYGSGYWHIKTLAYQAKFYRNIALTNPTGSPFGPIYPATFMTIIKRGVPIFSDLFIITNGLGGALLGIRNSLLALLLGGLATGLLHRFFAVDKPPTWVKVAFAGLLLAGLPMYTVVPLRFLVLSAAVPMGYLIVRSLAEATSGQQRQTFILLVLLTFIPTLFLLFMAWRSGHTFGITQRYSGFSFPYACILIALGLQQLVEQRWWFSVPLAGILLVQAGFVGQLLRQIYAGTEPKYTYFSAPRIKNPYWSSAQQLKQRYRVGDTILYPNMKRIIYADSIDKTYSSVALLDAQLVNVYLPPTADYWQRIDANEHDKIVLVKGKTGQKITIFDFKGTTYRY